MGAAVHMHGAEPLRHGALPPRPRSRRDVTPPPARAPRHQRPRRPRGPTQTRDKTLVRSKMADGSPERRAARPQLDDSTFSAPDSSHGDIKKCREQSAEGPRLVLSFYRELETSDSCEKSASSGVADSDAAIVRATDSRKSRRTDTVASDDRKKRCFDRYDSSESSDSGVAVLSPTESGGCSGSDITEPRSPRSPESSGEEGAGARMPPWASEPAPGPRRLAAQPPPPRRLNPNHRITEYFNHKMKPQTGLKRDHAAGTNDDKKKCPPKNGVTNDLEKYISYLSQTLSPKVLFDVENQADVLKPNITANCSADTTTGIDYSMSSHGKSVLEYCRPKDNNDRIHTTMNGFVDIQHGHESNKGATSHSNNIAASKKRGLEINSSSDPSANGALNTTKKKHCSTKRKMPIPANGNKIEMRIAPSTCVRHSPKKMSVPKTDAKMNGVVSSTTKLDTNMNGVTCGSNNLNLNIKSKIATKKDTTKKTVSSSKRPHRKTSACIANSKNLTWSKANNLKQNELQKQNCVNSVQNSPLKNIPCEVNVSPKIIPNGVRQVSMTVNNGLTNLNVPVTNFQNCHPLNLQHPQSCNGTVAPTNLASFMAVPHNVMLTTLRIPPNGLPAQTLTQQNGMHPYNRPNVNVSTSPTKLNGQFVFPFVQNINGTVVQIPNLMAKMPNFVVPQSAQLTAPRQEHMPNQQPAQILINGTLLKLANTMPSPYQAVNKPSPVTSQSMPIMNKNVTGMQAVGMTVQPKTSYTVNLNHPVLVPQPGFIVTSVPNINVKETWSCSSTNPTSSSSQAAYPNRIVHHPPRILANFTTQALHSSSIPIAPVKPPDNPIQGTEPPSSTVKEPEFTEIKNQKCDIPWLSKTVNNNIFPLNTNKITSRPFAQVSSMSKKLEKLAHKKKQNKRKSETTSKLGDLMTLEEKRKIDEVARREETIFTQITVLKDVTSNVESSVIEENFCTATTESSESGIGTDKSIDSPSDSQASKECDDDSSLSLSISISSLEAQGSQKSPILKQPKTLRFPPKNSIQPQSDERNSSTETTITVTVCQWENCKREFGSDSDLLEHLQSVHVQSQAGRQKFVCQWERCKVRGKPSRSLIWLERHTLKHGGIKPFKCIVDNCDRRFSTQILLERHVNNHFTEVSPNTNGKKTTDSSAKLIRRNGKKLRYRRQPWSARMFDFFDSGTMEGLAWRVSRCTRWRLGGACPQNDGQGPHTLALHAALTATRYNAAESRREALLTYYPPHVIEDEWVPEKEVRRVKFVEMSQLPAHTKVLLYEQFCHSYRKSPSPPPPPPPPAPPLPQRLLPNRQCTSSRLLNNLLAKKKRRERNCNATNLPMLVEEDKEKEKEVSGAKKRKMGRRYGGNAFWPCGR